MISTSYDLDDSNPKNSSNSLNDEESIFLSSSSDEDLPLSSRFSVSSSINKGKKNNFMETMINDGLGEDEGNSEESLLSSEAKQDSDEEVVTDDEECQYIPTPTYTEDDDHIEDVSDDEEAKPTKIYDEYDPENIDEFNDSALMRQNLIEYEPTKLQKSSDSETEASPEVKQKLQTHRTRSSKQIEKAELLPEQVRAKRKYNRKVPPVGEVKKSETSPASATGKRPYNNTNRAKNAELKKKMEITKNKKKQKLSNEMVISPQGSPVSADSSSDSNEETEEKAKTINTVKKIKTLESAGKSTEMKKKLVIPNSVKETSKNSVLPNVLSTTEAKPTNNIISGRIINLSSGFKIPKRPSTESDKSPIQSIPPEKKAKTSSTSDEPSTTLPVPNPIKSDKEKTMKLKSSKPSIEKASSSKSTSSTSSSSKSQKSVSKQDSKETSSTSKSSTSANQAAKPQKPEKLILKESDLFMDALGPSKPLVRSKPKIPKISSNKETKIVAAATPVASESTASPIEKNAPSQQLTNLNQQTNNLVNTLNDRDQPSPVNQTSTTTLPLTSEESQASSNGSKSSLTEPGLKKSNKKKVIWADSCQKKLEEVSYFYLDETEREIKKNAFKGGDMAKIEKLNEKELKFKHHDDYEPTEMSDSSELPWPTLIPIDLPDHIPQPEIKSAEHEIQVAREKDILEVLMFKQFLPDSPSEPTDSDNTKLDSAVMKVIPLEDVSFNQSTSDIDTSLVDSAVTINNEPQQNYNHNNNTNKSHQENNSSMSTFNQRSNFNKNHNQSRPYKNYNNNNNSNDKEYNNHGFYNNNKQQNQSNNNRWQLQQSYERDVKKNPSPPPSQNVPKLFTPTSPPRSPTEAKLSQPAPNLSQPPPSMIASTPLSPPVTTSNGPRLYSKAIEDSPVQPEITKKTAEPPAAASALISTLSNNLISDDMTEKIKHILSQINMTKPAATTTETVPKAPEVPTPVDAPTTDANKLVSLTDINFNANAKQPQSFKSSNNNKNNSNYNPDYKKNTKWNTPSNNTNHNTSNNYNNNNNNNYQSKQGNTNNRNSFQNNFRRGIGNNRHESNTHSNFQRQNNFNNNNDNGYHSNNKFQRPGSHNHDNGFRKNYNSRFDHYQNKKDSRFNDNGSGGRNNYENDSPPKHRDQAPPSNAGRWI